MTEEIKQYIILECAIEYIKENDSLGVMSEDLKDLEERKDYQIELHPNIQFETMAAMNASESVHMQHLSDHIMEYLASELNTRSRQYIVDALALNFR